MRRGVPSAIVALALVVGTAACGGGAPSSGSSAVRAAQPGTIQGWIFADAAGAVVLGRTEAAPGGATVLANASIALEETPAGAKATELARQATTDAKGFASFSGVRAGLWTLKVGPSTFPLTIIGGATLVWGSYAVTRTAALAAAKAKAGALDAARSFVLSPQTPLPAGVTIAPALGNDDGDADASLELKTTAPAWFFYVDVASDLRFQHATKFILVDAETGAVAAKDEMSWPSINGGSFYGSAGRNMDSPDAIQKPPKRPGATPPPVTTIEPAGARPAYLAPVEDHVPGCPYPSTYALIIQGSDEGSMADDAKSIKDLFGHGGIPPAGVRSWKPHDHSQPVDEVRAEFKKIQDEATSCDSIFIYITGHGTRGGSVKLDTDATSKDGIPRIFENLTAGAFNFSKCRACHITIIIDSCYSGKMLNAFKAQLEPLTGRKAIVMSASDATHQSGAYEWWNPKGRSGGAFTDALVDSFNAKAKGGGTVDLGRAFDDANTRRDLPGPDGHRGAAADDPAGDAAGHLDDAASGDRRPAAVVALIHRDVRIGPLDDRVQDRDRRPARRTAPLFLVASGAMRQHLGPTAARRPERLLP